MNVTPLPGITSKTVVLHVIFKYGLDERQTDFTLQVRDNGTLHEADVFRGAFEAERCLRQSAKDSKGKKSFPEHPLTELIIITCQGAISYTFTPQFPDDYSDDLNKGPIFEAEERTEGEIASDPAIPRLALRNW